MGGHNGYTESYKVLCSHRSPYSIIILGLGPVPFALEPRRPLLLGHRSFSLTLPQFSLAFSRLGNIPSSLPRPLLFPHSACLSSSCNCLCVSLSSCICPFAYLPLRVSASSCVCVSLPRLATRCTRIHSLARRSPSPIAIVGRLLA